MRRVRWSQNDAETDHKRRSPGCEGRAATRRDQGAANGPGGHRASGGGIGRRARAPPEVDAPRSRVARHSGGQCGGQVAGAERSAARRWNGCRRASRCARPAASCRPCALHDGAVPGVVVAGLCRLGVASSGFAGQAAAVGAKRASQGHPFRHPCCERLRQPRWRTLHRASAAGRAVQERSMEQAAVLLLPAMVPAQPAMVAQCDDRDRRRLAASRAGREFHGAPGAGRGLAGQFHCHKSGRSPGHDRGRRAEPHSRRDEFLGRLGA